MTGMLLIDVKETFNHVRQNCLLRTMEGICADRDLVRWTEPIMSDRSVRLVIDGHQFTKAEIETEVPQSSLVSPILFTIHLSSVFREVEEEVEGYTATSFVDDSR